MPHEKVSDMRSSRLNKQWAILLHFLSETAACAVEILELYRFRWQIQCTFKRLKTLGMQILVRCRRRAAWEQVVAELCER